jgi:replicative DNA helicase
MTGPPDITELRAEPVRLPVSNVAAEQGLLGALLCDNRELARVRDIVVADDFAWRAHQAIFSILSELISAGKQANPVTMGHLLPPDIGIPLGEGAKYLAKLAVSAVTTHNAPDYAAIVSDCAIRRKLVEELEEPLPAETVLEVLERHRERLVGFKRARLRLADG